MSDCTCNFNIKHIHQYDEVIKIFDNDCIVCLNQYYTKLNFYYYLSNLAITRLSNKCLKFIISRDPCDINRLCASPTYYIHNAAHTFAHKIMESIDYYDILSYDWAEIADELYKHIDLNIKDNQGRTVGDICPLLATYITDLRDLSFIKGT
jgi:hypothetical protein